MEKDLKNAELDKKIVERDLKDSKNENNLLTLQIDLLNKKMEDSRKKYDSALLELAGLNEDFSNQIISLKQLTKKLEEELHEEKCKSENKEITVDKFKTEIAQKDRNIFNLIEELKEVQKQKVDIEMQVVNHEKSNANLINQFERVLKEKADLLDSIETNKRDLNNNQKVWYIPASKLSLFLKYNILLIYD